MDPPVGSWHALRRSVNTKHLDLCNMYLGLDFYLALPSAETTNPHSQNCLHVHAACNFSTVCHGSPSLKLDPSGLKWIHPLDPGMLLGQMSTLNPKHLELCNTYLVSGFYLALPSAKTTNPHSPKPPPCPCSIQLRDSVFMVLPL
jgi:hypothetical protein